MPAPIDSPIKRIVVLMLENRSFDNMLGWLPREGHLAHVEGLTGDEYNHLDPFDATSPKAWVQRGALYEFEGVSLPQADSSKPADALQGPLHEFEPVNEQLSGTTLGPSREFPVLNNDFVSSFAAAQRQYADNLPANGPGQDMLKQVMACFTPEQVPALTTLARHFVLCDHWFCSLPGPTMPNRLFIHGATSAGYTWNAFSDTFSFRTIYNSLHDAGKTWAIYYANDNLATQFTQLDAIPCRFERFDDAFVSDVDSDNLPEYSFIIPRFIDWSTGEAGVQAANSQHAPSDVRTGEALLARVYDTLRANPKAWAETLLVVLYDEHGGFYDHVRPPSGVPNPDGIDGPTPEQAAKLAAAGKAVPPVFDFTRLGYRVPAVLVSPWLPRRLEKTHYEHASLLGTVRNFFGLADFLTERDRASNTFEHLLRRELLTFRDDCPERLPTLPLPPDERIIARAEGRLDPVQAELVRASINKLPDEKERQGALALLASGEMTRNQAHAISEEAMEAFKARRR